MADEGLRICIGLVGSVPSAATFSRAFSEFAELELGQRVHEALVIKEYQDITVWHVARDATSISNWERPVRMAKPPRKVKQRPGRKKGIPPKPKVESRQQKQLRQSPQEAISELPKACATGTKLDSNGFPHWWNGYKLHADVDESGFPLAVVLTGAGVHDSQVAIPLMKTTTRRTQAVFYQLMDAGYVGQPIFQAAKQLGQVPLVTPKATPTRPAIPLTPDRKVRMKRRCAVERFFAHLKNNYAIHATRYRGHRKVSLHIMFAVVVICASMILKQTNILEF
jgi:transposase